MAAYGEIDDVIDPADSRRWIATLFDEHSDGWWRARGQEARGSWTRGSGASELGRGRREVKSSRYRTNTTIPTNVPATSDTTSTSATANNDAIARCRRRPFTLLLAASKGSGLTHTQASESSAPR